MVAGLSGVQALPQAHFLLELKGEMTRVVLENVRVDFPIYGTQRSLRTALFKRATGGLVQRQGKNQDRVVVKALIDVSMTLQEGDRLGLVGHNGSGKSTLLKVIAGIHEPIGGSVRVEGQVTPLFDTMPGVDHDDSGYENIITAGLLLGMSREQVEKKIPQIEEFCELGEYLALPVRTYSAGMMTRLGFALATALDPGILLMDEAIGAGDARFAERAARRMDDFVGRSRIIVLASHAPALIRTICNKAALMQAGQILAIGPVDEIFDRYQAAAHGNPSTSAGGAEKAQDADGLNIEAVVVRKARTEHDWPVAEFTADAGMANQFAQCLGGSIEMADGVACGRAPIHLPFSINLRYRLLRDSPFTMVPNFHFHDSKGETVLVSNPLELAPTKQGDYVACCTIDPFIFNVGQYSVSLALSSMELAQPVHFYAGDVLRFEVIEPYGADPRRHGYGGAIPGVTRPRLQWRVAQAQ